MKCPHCPDAVLAMTDRQGVEIDYCPQCRGVWLDRGELDKLLKRAALPANAPPLAPASAPQQHYQHPQPQQPRRDFEDSDFRSGQRQKRPRSWLSEIFD